MSKEKKPSTESALKKAAKKKPRAAAKAAAPSPEKAFAAGAAAGSAAEPRIPSGDELHREIRALAYQFYRERGAQHGADESDWHRAERRVRAKYNK
jgi:hypothetical protein